MDCGMNNRILCIYIAKVFKVTSYDGHEREQYFIYWNILRSLKIREQSHIRNSCTSVKRKVRFHVGINKRAWIRGFEHMHQGQYMPQLGSVKQWINQE